MQQFLQDLIEDSPIVAGIGLMSAVAIVGGIGYGVFFKDRAPDPNQVRVEALATATETRKAEIEIANARFDEGCEGIVYFAPDRTTYQPLNRGVGVLSGEYWRRNRYIKPGAPMPAPNLSDYLAENTTICDAYGNTAVLKFDPSLKYSITAEMANTPDRNRIASMMKRYPKIAKPNVGAN